MQISTWMLVVTCMKGCNRFKWNSHRNIRTAFWCVISLSLWLHLMIKIGLENEKLVNKVMRLGPIRLLISKMQLVSWRWKYMHIWTWMNFMIIFRKYSNLIPSSCLRNSSNWLWKLRICRNQTCFAWKKQLRLLGKQTTCAVYFTFWDGNEKHGIRLLWN